VTPTPSDWLDALEAELSSLATNALGLPPTRTVARGTTPPASMEGAYLGLVSTLGPVQVGLASSSAGCQGFARGLMSMEGSAPPLPPSDVADAICEIVNMMAGGVQRRIRQKFGVEAQLGLPTFFHGHVQPTERLGVAVSEVRGGDVPAAVLVLHPRTRTTEGR
jgi:hypothetical protein